MTIIDIWLENPSAIPAIADRAMTTSMTFTRFKRSASSLVKTLNGCAIRVAQATMNAGFQSPPKDPGSRWVKANTRKVTAHDRNTNNSALWTLYAMLNPSALRFWNTGLKFGISLNRSSDLAGCECGRNKYVRIKATTGPSADAAKTHCQGKIFARTPATRNETATPSPKHMVYIATVRLCIRSGTASTIAFNPGI